MTSLIEKLKERGFIALGPVRRNKIIKAEKALSVVFSEEYKEYVSKYGCVSFVDHELTGVCSSKRLSVVNATIRARGLFPDIPATWYVIEETNVDGIVVWQDSTGEIFRTSPGSAPKKIFNSMKEYLEDQL